MHPRVILVGVAGYGARHLATLKELHASGRIELVALVDRQFGSAAHPARSSGFQEFADLESALDSVPADSVVIATPPHTHLALALTVVRRGLALYVEKPPVPLLQELDTLAAEVKPGQRVEVGFQFTPRNLSMLHQVWSAGRIGEVQRITAHAALGRADTYYQRSPWAGNWFMDGVAVLDGPLFNPCAHILHAALMAAGMVAPEWRPGRLLAECYSVRQINGDDLLAVRVEPCDGGPVVVAAATTAADQVSEPAITLHGTRGEATLRHRDGQVRVLHGGAESIVAAPADGPGVLERLVTSPRGAANELLTLAAVRPYVTVVNAIVEACRHPRRLCDDRREYRQEGETFQYLPGVSAAIRRVVSTGTLFAEHGEPWAAPGARADLQGYTRFTHPALIPNAHGK